mmetsp:Transcript_1711/g.3595  ORF Transcript_1711/g.3595 Transcript_1711/m.3595 type:complete len:286 (+) Transcript_1711:302-1159(+)
MWVWWSSAEKVRFILVLCEQLVSRFMTSSSPALASAGPAWTSPATLRTDSMVIFRTTPTVTSSSIVSFAPIVSMWNHVGSLGSKTGSPSTRKSTPLASNSAFCWLSLVLSAASCSLSSCSFFCSLFSFSAHHARSATLIAADTGPMILSAKLAPALAPLPIALAPPAAPSAAVVVAKVASPTVLATPTPTADSAATGPPPALPAAAVARAASDTPVAPTPPPRLAMPAPTSQTTWMSKALFWSNSTRAVLSFWCLITCWMRVLMQLMVISVSLIAFRSFLDSTRS